jgi:hypothetical protein
MGQALEREQARLGITKTDVQRAFALFIGWQRLDFERSGELENAPQPTVMHTTKAIRFAGYAQVKDE